MKIVLLGYMGSGKSTIGKLLSKKLNLPFYDLDSLIEEKIKLRISEIFKNKGEVYFRKIENEVLKDILNEKNDMVLALGGGTPCYFDNMDLLSKCFTIYIKASATKLISHLKDELNQRPLLKDKTQEELVEFINKHLFERNVYYHQAHHVVAIDNKTKEEVLDEIMDLLT